MVADDQAVVPSVRSRPVTFDGQLGDETGDPFWRDIKEPIRVVLTLPYPDVSGMCDLVLPNGTPLEAKLIRYWRANGDSEPTMYSHVFSPCHRNTLLTDARRLHASEFGEESGLFGLFYRRADGDPKTVEALPERYTAADVAEKIVRDVHDLYDAEASVCRIAEFDGLQHTVHGAGAAISWIVE